MIKTAISWLGLGGVGLKGWLWLGTAMAALAALAWLATTLYLAGVNSERVKALEATIAAVQAKLQANDEIRRQAEADAARSEAEAEKQKELLDELRKSPPSCALAPEHVDGVRRIDRAP